MILRGEAEARAYTAVGGRVGRRSEAILLIKRWGIDPNKLTIKPDESPRDRSRLNTVLRFRKCPCARSSLCLGPVCNAVRVGG